MSEEKKTYNILHLSDLHVGHENNKLDELIYELAKEAEGKKIDVVIFTGDIFNVPPVIESNKQKIIFGKNKTINNKSGLIDNEKKKELIKEAVNFFDNLCIELNKGGNNLEKKDFCFVAGNHDLYEQSENNTWSLYEDFLTEFYENVIPQEYIHKPMFIKVDSTNHKVLLGFDSNIDYRNKKKQFIGHISKKQLCFVDKFLKDNRDYRDYEKIAFFHHPCNFFEEQDYRNTEGIMNNSLDVSKKLAEWNVKLILHGHKHWAKTSIYRPLVGQKIYVFGAGAIGSLRDLRSCYIIEMGEKIQLQQISSKNKNNFKLRPIKIVDNYMEGMLLEVIKIWKRDYTDEEKNILNMINKLFLSYEQLSFLQHNHVNLLMLENAIKSTLGICENEDSFGKVDNDEWCEVKRMLNNLETLERNRLQIDSEKKCYLAFALLGKFFAELYIAITSISRKLVRWNKDNTEFNLYTCCYFVYFDLNTDDSGDQAWQELNQIMKRFQEQLYEIQDYLYCIKLNIKKIFLELRDDRNHKRHYDFDASIPRLIQLLTGTNIYCDKYSFVRELIQNSIDAVSFRANQSNSGKTYEEPIEIDLGCYGEDKRYFKIRDYGIGMKQDTIERYFATLGRSYYKEYTERKHIKYNSVSNFGIGFLSVFKPCSKIIIKTKHFEEEQCYNLEINGVYGHYMISHCSQSDFEPGTEITCYFNNLEVKEEEIIAYIKKIMLDIKYSIKIRRGSESKTICAREVRKKEYHNIIFVPFDEDTKKVAELEEEIIKNLEEELLGLNERYRHGILIRPEQKQNAGVDILSAGILLKNAKLEDIFRKNMEDLHYMKVTMNFPPNWLDIDVSREKASGIREDYINKIEDLKKDICKELKRQLMIAIQEKKDRILGFFREAVNFVNIFEENNEEEEKQNLWNLKVYFKIDEIKFQLNNAPKEYKVDNLFHKWAIEILPDHDGEISNRNHKAIKLLYKSLSQDEASAIHRMLQEQKSFTESRETLQKLGLNIESVDDRGLLLVPAIFLDKIHTSQEEANHKDELQKLVETAIWENYTVRDAVEGKDSLLSVKYDNFDYCRMDMESIELQKIIDAIAKLFNNKVLFTGKYDFIWNYIIWNNLIRYGFCSKDNKECIRKKIQSRYEHLRDSIKIIYFNLGKLIDIYTIASCYMSALMDLSKEELQIKGDTNTLTKYEWILDVGLGFLYMWILSESSEKRDKLYAMYNQNKLDNILDNNIKSRYIRLLAFQEKRTLDVLCFAELLHWIDLYIKNKILA